MAVSKDGLQYRFVIPGTSSDRLIAACFSELESLAVSCGDSAAFPSDVGSYCERYQDLGCPVASCAGAMVSLRYY